MKHESIIIETIDQAVDYYHNKGFFGLGPENSHTIYMDLITFFHNSRFGSKDFVELEYIPGYSYINFNVPANTAVGLAHYHRIELVKEPCWGNGELKIWV